MGPLGAAWSHASRCAAHGPGLPATTQYLLLPLIASVLAVAMLALMIWLWIRRFWSLPTRLGYTLSTLTLLGFSTWLAWLAVPIPTNIVGW